jgi:hypothetical protein
MVVLTQRRAAPVDSILLPSLAYGAASLVHHVHNAVHLSSYPNMPVSLSPARVYLAWLVVAGFGLVGYLLSRGGHWLAGLLLLGIYGLLGLYGLLHYTLAPMPAHTWAMNATIWLEVSTAANLLIEVARLAVRRWRGSAAG